MLTLQAPQFVEACNKDGHADVYIHIDNVPDTNTSIKVSNGTQLAVTGDEGDAYFVSYNGRRYGIKKRHCKAWSGVQVDSACIVPLTIFTFRVGRYPPRFVMGHNFLSPKGNIVSICSSMFCHPSRFQFPSYCSYQRKIT